MSEKNLGLLVNLKSQVEAVPNRNSSKLNAVKQRAEMLISRIFDKNSNYHKTLNKLRFSPLMVMNSSGQGPYDGAWKRGVEGFVNLVDTMIEDVSLSIDDTVTPQEIAKKSSALTDRIFIVHGHNEEMKQSVARLIEKLGLNPIILHEQANKGKTIIQKFIDNSDVGFSIVLMSADDYGYAKSLDHTQAKHRARQNVILELGFFLGKLGTERVIALFETTDNFEIPSDYDGILFIPYDTDGRWKFDVVKELKSIGYEIDANRIL